MPPPPGPCKFDSINFHNAAFSSRLATNSFWQYEIRDTLLVCLRHFQYVACWLHAFTNQVLCPPGENKESGELLRDYEIYVNTLESRTPLLTLMLGTEVEGKTLEATLKCGAGANAGIADVEELFDIPRLTARIGEFTTCGGREALGDAKKGILDEIKRCRRVCADIMKSAMDLKRASEMRTKREERIRATSEKKAQKQSEAAAKAVAAKTVGKQGRPKGPKASLP